MGGKKNVNRELGKIESTMLGFEDHGIMSFWLTLDFGGSGQGFGGYCLGGTFTHDVLTGILEAVGVEKWEDLKGKPVWVRREDGSTGAEAWGEHKIVAVEAPDFVKHKGEFDIGKCAKAHEAEFEKKRKGKEN